MSSESNPEVGTPEEHKNEDLRDAKVNIENFVKAKNKLNNKLKVFENVYKFYKYIIMDEILVSLNKSLKFLTKYELIIISTINKYNTDKDGYLDLHQSRMLITIIQRYLFDKIFVNYLLPNISKYYDFTLKEDIENLIDHLKFIDNKADKDAKHERMKKNIITNLDDSKFKLNHTNKVKEFNDSLYNNEDSNIDHNFVHLTVEEQKDIKDNISNSFINKFETLENKFIDIQSTSLWWNILKYSLIKELTNSNKDYVECVIIFIKQMLTESMYNDILNLEHVSLRKSSKNKAYIYDNNLYKIYDYHLKNDLNSIFDTLDISNNLEDIKIHLIDIEKKIKTSSDNFDSDISKEYDNILSTSGISDGASIYHLRKTKITLVNKFKSYTDILLTIINAIKKNSKKINQQDHINNFGINNNKVLKYEFREIVETSIIYLKQNLLNFFDIYQNYISELRKYQKELFETSDKLNN